MKKFLIILSILCISILKSQAMTFDEAFAQSSSKPMLVLIYAQWADNYQTYLNNFKSLQTQFGDTFNFVELDIASKDTKSFNSRYHIYPNLPYVLMFRDGGKVSRYIQKSCASDFACLADKVKSFIR